MQVLPLSPWDYGDRLGQSSFLLCCISKILFGVNLKGQKKKGGGVGQRCKSFTSLLRKPLPSYQPRNAEWALGEQSRPGLDCSVPQSCPTLFNSMDCGSPGFSVLHHLLEFAQTHVHRVSDAIQPSHPLSSPSPHAFNLSQHQGLFQWVHSSHQVAKVLKLQHLSLQWIFRVDFL